MSLYIFAVLRSIPNISSSSEIKVLFCAIQRMDNIGCYLVVSLLASYCFLCASSAPVYSVLSYGAIGDGKTDDTPAFLKAWNAACGDPRAPKLVVPSGKTFLVGLIYFMGPCSSKIHVKIDGEIVAPNEMWIGEIMGHWINFENIEGLIIEGHGKMDGKGSIWWPCLTQNKTCPPIPGTLAILRCKDIKLRGLRFVNSPRKHVTFNTTVGVHVSKLNILAPGNSPNTDGIYFTRSSHLHIDDSIIATGDDCISIGDNTTDVKITRIECGPGHGISVGSLGKNNALTIVERLHISRCNISGTTNGLRIKTWQGGSGHAKKITFDHIRFSAVQRPILIDQFYCDRHGLKCPNQTSAVRISDVRYKNILGTSASDVAITLNCSQSMACTNILLDNVVITPAPITINGPHRITASCFNARGKKKQQVIPDVPCLT